MRKRTKYRPGVPPDPRGLFDAGTIACEVNHAQPLGLSAAGDEVDLAPTKKIRFHMGVRKLNLPKILAWVTLAAGLAVALFGHFATRYTQRSQAFEKNDCVFSYAQVHAYFTIPPTIVLWLLNRPFQCQLYRAKLVLLPTIAFVWTTPWDNELVRQRAWRYPRSCVLGTVGFVPIEEYFFVSARFSKVQCEMHGALHSIDP